MILDPARLRAVRVSVAITNYNYGRYLGDAIESVLAQTRKADQIVVVDDGSTDDSRAVIERYSSHVVAVLMENGGVVAATNEAIASCDGDVVAFLDADDLMLPDRLAAITSVYEASPEVQWVFNGTQRVDRASLNPLARSHEGRRAGRQDVRQELRAGSVPMSTPPSSGLSFRRGLLSDLAPLPAGSGNQDALLALLAMAGSVGHLLAEPLTLHGIHESNRFSGRSGGARASAIACHYAWMARCLENRGPELRALGDHFTERALWQSRMGSLLPAPERRMLFTHLRGLTMRRQIRIARTLLRRLAHRAVRGSRPARS